MPENAKIFSSSSSPQSQIYDKTIHLFRDFVKGSF
jgi:hypothetical protein